MNIDLLWGALMPIHLDFVEPARTIYLTTSDPITLADMERAAEESFAIHSAAAQPIYTLLDASQIRAIPQGALRGHARPEFNHPMAGGVVVFGANLLVRTITSVVAKLAQKESIRYFGTAEEAWAYIQAKIAADDRVGAPELHQPPPQVKKNYHAVP